MFKIKITDERLLEILVVLLIIGIPALMFMLNFYFLDGKIPEFITKDKEKTVIVTQVKQNDALPKIPSKAVVNSVREAIKNGNYSTAYLTIGNLPKDSPESRELTKQLEEEVKKRKKAPGVRKEAGVTPAAPVRYLDESTPRNRLSDAIYVYFVDISGTFFPHFCIQVASKKKLGVTGFTVTADNKKIDIIASSIKLENSGKGVAEWYDVPLDRFSYETVQTMIKSRKVTLTVNGSDGAKTRIVSENEIKGLKNILAGYAALGGQLNYMQTTPAAPSTSKPKH